MPDEMSLPEPLRSQLRGELQAGERVRWVGQPLPPTIWGPMPMVLMGLAFAGLAMMLAAFEAGLTGEQPSWWRFAVCVVGAIPGLALMWTGLCSWLRLRRAAAGTFYAVTDRRVLLRNAGYFGLTVRGVIAETVLNSVGPGVRTSSITPDRLQNVERNERRDGSGDILFDDVDPTFRRQRTTQLIRMGFYSVADVQEPARLLKELIESHRPPRS